MKINPTELRELAALIHRHSGIVIDSSKAYLVESRLSPMLEESALSSFGALIAAVRNAPPLINQIIDLMTTNETSFFRDQKPYTLLTEKLLPDWLGKQRNGPGNLDIWSSACSTGQEVYSIAMTLSDFFKKNLFYHTIKIEATDISDSAITKASRGQYSPLDVSRGLDAASLNKFFLREGTSWKIKDELRSLAHFEQTNLLSSTIATHSFDIIFCRNVAIYFSATDRQRLFAQISKRLKENGVLIIGSTESLFGINKHLKRMEHNGSPYYMLR
nr:protein-glutamate O-methyltransferase CheR [Desulfobulbaceae bacterium]